MSKTSKPREQRPLFPQRKAKRHSEMPELWPRGRVVGTRQSSRRAVLWVISIKIHSAKGLKENKNQLGMRPRQLGKKYLGGAQRLLLRSPPKAKQGWMVL